MDRAAEFRSEFLDGEVIAMSGGSLRRSGIAQDHIRVEQYTRQNAHTWTLRDYEHPGDTLPIESIGASLPLAAIYDRIEFAPE